MLALDGWPARNTSTVPKLNWISLCAALIWRLVDKFEILLGGSQSYSSIFPATWVENSCVNSLTTSWRGMEFLLFDPQSTFWILNVHITKHKYSFVLFLQNSPVVIFTGHVLIVTFLSTFSWFFFVSLNIFHAVFVVLADLKILFLWFSFFVPVQVNLIIGFNYKTLYLHWFSYVLFSF